MITFRIDLFNENTQTFDMAGAKVNEDGLRHILKKSIGMNKGERNDFVARVLVKDASYIKALNPDKKPYSLHCVKITQGRPIVDDRTGVVYPSHIAATKVLGAPREHMAQFFAGERKDVEGHTFTAYLGTKE